MFKQYVHVQNYANLQCMRAFGPTHRIGHPVEDVMKMMTVAWTKNYFGLLNTGFQKQPLHAALNLRFVFSRRPRTADSLLKDIF